jgi:beta-N-acetylhexosaminidase
VTVVLTALLAAVATLTTASLHAATPALTPQQKASLLVVSGLPAPAGVGGVIVHPWDRAVPRPPGALVFVDQEGGQVRAFPELPPAAPASSYASAGAAFAAGRDTGRALRAAHVDVDLAPVLDAPDGPLGSRLFRRQSFGLAFARGLRAGGTAACVKHFPGLGSTRISTDESPHVDGVVRAGEVAGFAAAVRAAVPCVMIGHAFYRRFGPFRASLEPKAYGLLRSLGFRGVAITDSLSLVRSAPVERWAPQAARAGADLLLFTSPAHARRAIAALLPLARRGELDEHVARVFAFRSALRR